MMIGWVEERDYPPSDTARTKKFCVDEISGIMLAVSPVAVLALAFFIGRFGDACVRRRCAIIGYPVR